MTYQTGETGNDGWQRLIAAREMYTQSAGVHYDEVLDQVAQRAHSEGSIGKADIGALLLWKRLRVDTRWASALMATADAEVRRATAAAMTAVLDASVSLSEAARAGRGALAGLPGYTRGDALASTVLTAAAPHRMAVYDRRAHASLRSLRPTAHRRSSPLHRRPRPPPGPRPLPRPRLDTPGPRHRPLLPATQLGRHGQRVGQVAKSLVKVMLCRGPVCMTRHLPRRHLHSYVWASALVRRPDDSCAY